MKKSLMMTAAVMLIAVGANADVLFSEDFSYPDGILLGNGIWVAHSGEGVTPVMVENGQAVLVMGGGTREDVNVPLGPNPGGNIYYSFDFSVDDLGEPWVGTDSEYFAHFGDSGFGYRGRMDIVPAPGGGDFSLGLATSGGTADVSWSTDLSYDTVYRVVVRYDQATNIAQLWVDPTTPSSPSVLSADNTDPGDTIERFMLRQAGSSMVETVRVDNIVVATECEDSFESCAVAVEAETWGAVKSLYR